ncbi:restriction endonuclease subunit S [Clostridium sp. UBA3061]|uniref:restriction endonuclease subunit S n=1 Tax=Clostridium sp. UBA3061 TaxID=1946353 RepID=UPI003216B13F
MEYIRLGDLYKITKGKKVDALEEINNDSVRYIQIDDLRNNNNIKYCMSNGKYVFAKKEDLIIAWDGANAGTIGYGIEGAIGSTLALLRTDNKLVYTPFIGRYMQAQSKTLRDKCMGATIPHIQKSVLEDILIPKYDIKIQQKIATILDKAQSLIDKRKEQIEAYDELVKSLFYEMFGDAVLNPKGWDIRDLGTLGYFKNGMNYKQSDSGFNIKFLGVSEFKYGNTINNSNILPTLELQQEPNEEYLLKKGDIIFVRSNGSKELVGRSILVRELEEKTIYSGFCIRYRNQCREVIPDFLIQLFLDQNFKKSLKKDSRGANINNLNQQMLSSLKVIVPPLPLQNKFAAQVEKIEQQKKLLEQSLKELENNFNSLMQRAFKGELF